MNSSPNEFESDESDEFESSYLEDRKSAGAASVVKLDAMTEEEQMEYAMKLSMQVNKNKTLLI